MENKIELGDIVSLKSVAKTKGTQRMVVIDIGKGNNTDRVVTCLDTSNWLQEDDKPILVIFDSMPLSGLALIEKGKFSSFKTGGHVVIPTYMGNKQPKNVVAATLHISEFETEEDIIFSYTKNNELYELCHKNLRYGFVRISPFGDENPETKDIAYELLEERETKAKLAEDEEKHSIEVNDNIF